MELNQNLIKLLRLKKAEQKVLAVLSSEPKTPTEIVGLSKLPRATVYLALSTLFQRGLIHSTIQKGRRYWLEESAQKLESGLSQTLKSLRHLTQVDQLEIKHKDDTSVVIHRGAKAMNEVILRAINLNEGERVQVFQDSRPDDGWVRVIGIKNILKINALLKKRHIIGESIIPETYFSRLVPYLGKKWAISYVDRINIVYMLPERYFLSLAEIITFRDRALIIHMGDEIAVEIKNPQILLLIKSMLEVLKESGRKVNMHEEIKKYL